MVMITINKREPLIMFALAQLCMNCALRISFSSHPSAWGVALIIPEAQPNFSSPAWSRQLEVTYRVDDSERVRIWTQVCLRLKLIPSFLPSLHPLLALCRVLGHCSLQLWGSDRMIWTWLTYEREKWELKPQAWKVIFILCILKWDPLN